MLMLGGALLALALPCFVIFAVLRIAGSKGHRRLRGLVETPTTPLAQVLPGQLVMAHGRASASEQGRVLSPVSGREVLRYEVEIQEWIPGGRSTGPGSGSHHTIRRLTDQRAFWLDDGSGQRAWIDGRTAHWVMETRSYADSPGKVIGGLPETVAAWTPQLAGFAQQMAGGSQRRLKIATRELEEGVELRALGTAQVHQGTTCFGGGGTSPELVLGTVGREQLSRLTGRRTTTYRVAGLLGCTMALGGVVLVAVAIYLWAVEVGLAG